MEEEWVSVNLAPEAGVLVGVGDKSTQEAWQVPDVLPWAQPWPRRSPSGKATPAWGDRLLAAVSRCREWCFLC